VHQIPPAHDFSPEQVMWQVTPAPPQLTVSLHEARPEQVSTDEIALAPMLCGQAPSPLQVTEQSRPAQFGDQPQLLAPLQVICVLGASLSTARAHASLPLQATEQKVPPQYTESAQDLSPLQRMSQLEARVQSTKPAHAASPQVAWHGIPTGQTTPAAQEPGALQSKTQAPPASRY
jgi:hypothetical protein